jgi:hypothetical protein
MSFKRTPRRRKLVREGEPKQKTATGLEIPVPKTEDFNRLLRKAATKRERPKES